MAAFHPVRSISAFIALALFVSTALIPCSCSRRRQDRQITPSPEYATLVKAYTGGSVTDGTPVRIEFNTSVPGIEAGSDASPELFSFSPSLKGSARWVSPDILEFIPEAYRPGTTYMASLRIDKIAGLNASGKFEFSFHAAAKEAHIYTGHVLIPSSDTETASIHGHIDFSEEVQMEDASKMLSCRYEGKDIPLTLEKSSGGFAFTAAGLERGTKDRTAVISFNGKEYGFSRKEGGKITVPAINSFYVMEAVQTHGTDPYIEIVFSEALQQDMDPTGMFSLKGAGKHYTKIEGNIVKLYYEKGGDEITLNVSQGVQSIQGTKLDASFRKVFSENEIKPAVEIPLKGNILPDGENLIFPFRSVNLSAVDISVIKIYESNVLMFLQTNSLNGSDELRRSGRMVYRKTIQLDSGNGKDLHQWQDFSADLSGLFRQEPGAIYRIKISFRQEYSLYGKAHTQSTVSSMVSTASGDMTQAEASVWDEPYPYFYDNSYDWRTYRWSDRDNPHTPSYYMVDSRFPERNILSSNIGVIVKDADNDRIYIAVNDIMTAKPLQGAIIQAYSYQLKKIGEATSGKDGFAEIRLGGQKPFAITARSGNAVSYLKVTDGTENSLSRFDTGGKTVESGIKGFVYGERGVWRPGDTLHVTIIIEDRQHTLPDNHPVTVELYNPQGQFYDKQISTKGADGMYSFSLVTKEDDPTGTWNAYFKVGGATFHKALSIETIKPNRLKLDLSISDKVLQAGRRTMAALNASWLSGPAAANLNAKVEMTLKKADIAIKGYEKYIFNNPVSEFSAITSTAMSGMTDGKGKLSAELKLPSAKDAPGMLSATLVTRVTEPGGDESFTTSSMPFSPYDAYAGILLPEAKDGYLETDKEHRIKTILVDKDGSVIFGHQMEYRIYELKWSWWWESRSESLDSYVNGTSANIVSKGQFISSAKGTEIPLKINYPDWGRYLIYVKDLTCGHASGGIVYVDWPSWRGRAERTDPDGLTMLTFSLDKKSYKTGEEATVFIPAAKGGQALVSLENGSGVISREWIETSDKEETQYRFRISEGMAPNFYVHITLLQPHGNTENDLPIRMYGVQPVFVEDPETHLAPEISMPDVLRPQETFTVKVKEKNGKPMSYTLAIVDEGLLDITGFKTPDPWKAMYAREALGVKTWDMYDDVIGAFSGRFSPLFSIGGDEDVLKSNKRDNRFNPVVKFLGPFTLPAKGTGTHKVTLPMYIGSVKAMVVAGADGAYGNASKAVPVRSPLMILSSLPRILGTGEQVKLPVNVFAMEDSVRDVKITVNVSGAARISGTSGKEVRFNAPGDKLAEFGIVTGEHDGTAEIKIKAEGGGHSASETIYIKVRNPEPAVTSVFSELIYPGKTAEIGYGAFTPAEGEWATAELAGFPSIDFAGCFNFVADYSHYCTEQLSAKGLTMLYLSNLVQETEKKTAQESIPQIIKQICLRQLPDGGFVYWPGQSNADEWVSSMAGQFLTKAAAKGYEVNSGVLRSWKNFQKRCIRNYRESNANSLYDFVQAYRLYTLAVASDPDSGAMNRLKSSPGLSSQAAWNLAAAYAISGKKTIAKDIVKNLRTEVDRYSSSNLTYGSSLRDRAMFLETLILIDDMAGAMKLAEELSREFSEASHYTTQNTAFLSMAMSRLAEKANTDVLDAVVDGKKIKSSKSVYSMPVDPSAGKTGITNNSKGTIYATITTRRQMEAGSVTEASSGIGIKPIYTDANGKKLNLEDIRQGEDIYATISVSNTTGTTDCTGLALTVTTPSGWEIFNERLTGTETGKANYTYMDIRDDKTIYYFDLPRGTRKQFNVRFHAGYCGEFTVPSIRCEAMYDPATYARTASAKTIVH